MFKKLRGGKRDTWTRNYKAVELWSRGSGFTEGLGDYLIVLEANQIKFRSAQPQAGRY